MATVCSLRLDLTNTHNNKKEEIVFLHNKFPHLHHTNHSSLSPRPSHLSRAAADLEALMSNGYDADLSTSPPVLFSVCTPNPDPSPNRNPNPSPNLTLTLSLAQP